MPAKWPVVIASANQKGGCAKTSSLFHIAAAYAQRQLRVLLVDMDPQATMSRIIYPDQQWDDLPDTVGVTALLGGLNVPPLQLIHPGRAIWESTISLLPATKGLRSWNYPVGTEFDRLAYCLHQYLAEMAEHFDVVLVDTPPNLELLTLIGLLASDAAYTPAAPEDFDIHGIHYVEAFVVAAQQHNPPLRWLGVLKSKVQPRLAVHAAYSADLFQRYGVLEPGQTETKLFDTILPYTAGFKDAVWAKTPLPLWKPKSADAKTVVRFAEELARRAGFLLPPVPQPQKRSRRKAA